ncbi:unnamed protein product [Oncorhynchus mykiss]|uniref:Uncharacterized protein n=1 Tax=Oncorhynchus mykiss TaxID=8022 RepID=A0A060ZIZ6_ONCMY|nr:unnamed protein product [Oncorhynchus mykiss]
MPSASSSSLTNEVPKPPTRGGEQPPTRPPYTPTLGGQAPHSHQFPRTRKMFDKGPSGSEQAGDDADDPGGHKAYMNANLSTGLCDWSAKYFAQPVMKVLYYTSLPYFHPSFSVTHSLSPPLLNTHTQYCSTCSRKLFRLLQHLTFL